MKKRKLQSANEFKIGKSSALISLNYRPVAPVRAFV